MKRPFRKLKGIPPETDAYAIKHNRRPFIFALTSESGGTGTICGTVSLENVKRLFEILTELNELSKH